MKRWGFPLLAACAILAFRASPVSAIDNTWLDRYHAYIENDMYGTVMWFDRFFEDDLHKEVTDPEFSLRWTNDFRWDEEEHFRFRTRVRARIRLPRFRGKWKLLISGENKGDPTAIREEDPGNPGLASSSMGRRASTELVYDLLKTNNTIVDAGVGLRIKFSPNAFMRARLLHARELPYSIIGRVAVTPFWDAKDGLGESTQIDFERPFAPQTLLRWSNSATISERTIGWDWGTELSVLRKLSPDSAITFAANASGPTRPSAVVYNYRVYARYRRNFLRSWLFYELEPDVNWPLQDGGGRKTVLGGTMRLEVNFVRNKSVPKPP